MFYRFASDIHGSAFYCEKMPECYGRSGARRLILLGDILYHGPRNGLPRRSAPEGDVFRILTLEGETVAAVSLEVTGEEHGKE